MAFGGAAVRGDFDFVGGGDGAVGGWGVGLFSVRLGGRLARFFWFPVSVSSRVFDESYMMWCGLKWVRDTGVSREMDGEWELSSSVLGRGRAIGYWETEEQDGEEIGKVGAPSVNLGLAHPVSCFQSYHLD